jgi:acetoin utilization protein AcuB
MLQHRPVSEFMTQRVTTIGPSEKLEALRQLLESGGFHHVPVMEEGRLVGMVSYTDYLQVIGTHFQAGEDREESLIKLHSLRVWDMMTKDPITLRPNDTLEKALRLFRQHSFHSLPVTDNDGHLLGLLTTTDVMKSLEGALAPEGSADLGG